MMVGNYVPTSEPRHSTWRPNPFFVYSDLLEPTAINNLLPQGSRFQCFCFAAI